MKQADKWIRASFVVILSFAGCLFAYAMFFADGTGEVDVGSFSVSELSEGWTLTTADGVTQNVKLPLDVRASAGQTARLTNTLPGDVRDGMRLCFRTQRQDVVISINGEARVVYRAEDFHHRKVPLSAYLTAELRDADAGGTIELELVSKSGGSGQYHTVTYAYGNNVWLPIIAQNIALVAVSTVLALLGLVTIPVCLVVRRRTPSVKTVLYLGEAILVAGLWSLSESPLRQLIFRAPSGSNVFAFLLVEILAAFVLMYFNELQKHRYDRLYVSLEACILIQALVNAALNATELVDYYNTLIFSHIWLALGILLAVVTMVLDKRAGRTKEYPVTSIGILCLLAFSVLELLSFYFAPSPRLGPFLGTGLVLLLGATVIQTASDALRDREAKKYAYYDQMTGIRNRRAFEEELQRLAGDMPRELCVVMADLNGLKKTNDTLGHKAGDELIIGTAECLTRAFEGCESIFRIGGDEFCVLLGASEETARGGLDRLEALAADWKGSCSRGISVSCGLSFAVDCADLDALVREADHRMYENKRAFYAKSGNDRRSR